MKQAPMSTALVNDLAEIDRVIELVESFGEGADLSAKVVQQAVLVLDELITNIISYGYQDGERGRIEVSLAVEDDMLTIEIVDDGRPFDVERAPPPKLGASVEQRQVGGLGIHIARSLMDSVRYEHRQDRNCVMLAKRISGG